MEPKILKPLSLAEILLKLGLDDVTVWVWVNPPESIRNEGLDAFRDLLAKPVPPKGRPFTRAEQIAIGKEILGALDRLIAWMATLLSQGEDSGTHWSAEQIMALATANGMPGVVLQVGLLLHVATKLNDYARSKGAADEALFNLAALQWFEGDGGPKL